MAVTVKIDLGYEFAVKAKYDDVFAVMADVPTSASHFPRVDQLTDMGDGVYKWEMQKVGIRDIGIQTVYASKYETDKTKGTVAWTPVQGVGNALMSGHCKVTGDKESTRIALNIEGDVNVPFPALMKIVVQPLVEIEFDRLVGKYIANLIEEFGGEVV